MAKHRHLAE